MYVTALLVSVLAGRSNVIAVMGADITNDEKKRTSRLNSTESRRMKSPNKSTIPPPNCGRRFARRRSLTAAAVDVGPSNKDVAIRGYAASPALQGARWG
jgi:hypothetical protein